MDMPAAAVLYQIGGKFRDHDRDLVDAVWRQPDFSSQITNEAAAFGNVACVGDRDEHAISNVPA
jgi:hypothetical protein